MKIVFTGIQWCGKWTQARILAEKYGFKILELWTEFRNIVKSGTELWNKIKAVIEQGHQVPEDLWKELMQSVILENTDENIIYDGFIRNQWNLELNKAKKRLYWRVYDPETWETFPGDISFNPKTWNKLIKREDDKNIDSVKRRFNEFVEKTLPTIEIQQKQWIVYEINADQEISEVTKELEEKLWLA